MSQMINELKGDSISRLLQVRAAMAGVYMKWTGNALADIDLLCVDYFHRKGLNECLWNGLKQLMEMPEMEELKKTHEPIYAQILSIILRAQANFELKRAETASKPKPIPVGAA